MGLSGEGGHHTGFHSANRANRPAALFLTPACTQPRVAVGVHAMFYEFSLLNLIIMQTENVKAVLRKIILENEGDRDDIFSDVLEIVIPLIVTLTDISEPSGAFSKDPLTHANNVIENCSSSAKDALDEFFDSIA